MQSVLVDWFSNLMECYPDSIMWLLVVLYLSNAEFDLILIGN